MDRDDIERQDFPAARRGYEPTAVDAHLRRVADEFDALGRAGTLSEGASTQVRTILEAAESSARQLRAEAGREAGGQIERVEDAAKGMIDKLDRLQAELDRLLAGLKSTAETLAGSLDELSRDVGTLSGAPPAAVDGTRSDDEAGARLVALNMALEGTPREEAARFLAEHYAVRDLDSLLEDVYSSAGR